MNLNEKLSRAKAWAKRNQTELIIYGASAAVSAVVGIYINGKITDHQIAAFEKTLAKGSCLIPMPHKQGSYIVVPLMYKPDIDL